MYEVLQFLKEFFTSWSQVDLLNLLATFFGIAIFVPRYGVHLLLQTEAKVVGVVNRETLIYFVLEIVRLWPWSKLKGINAEVI